jgi:hypothetical protein
VPDRTRCIETRRASGARRSRAYRARLKAAREAAEHLANVKATEARRLATRIKVAAHRARQAEYQAKVGLIVAGAWFEQPLTDSEWEQYTQEQGWEPDLAREKREKFDYVARCLSLNVNRFLLAHTGIQAIEQRAVFHEAIEQGLSIAEACEVAKATKFIPKGQTPIEQKLDRERRLHVAEQKWLEGDEIIGLLKIRIKEKRQ